MALGGFASGQTLPTVVQARLDELLLKADALRKEGKNDEALKLLNQAVWFDSECGQCFALRAAVLGNLQRFKEGLGDAYIGITKSKKPRDKALAAYNKGFNLGGLGRNSEAEEAYNDCIRFDATFPMCYFGKGKTLVGIEKFQEALKALETATTLNPKHGPSWAFKANAEGGLGMLAASMDSAINAVQLAPNDPRSFLARAYAYGLTSRFAEMLADVDRALELDPQRPLAHLLRGQALTLLGRREEAAKEFDLEVDRTAVSKALHPERHIDTRIYNCGDTSTEIQTPDNFNVDGFKDCQERAMKALMESAVPAQSKPAPKPNRLLKSSPRE